MELDFVKMHGAGNDFVFVDDLSRELDLSAEQVRFLCDRHFGVGADGVILVRPSERADCAAYMHYINDDGSLAEMCGNGVRCFAKYLVDRGFVAASEGRFVADTLAGKRPISFEIGEDGLLTQATVDMGEAVFAPQRIPTTLVATGTVQHATQHAAQQTAVAEDAAPSDTLISEPAVVNQPLNTPLGALDFTCVNMGNPHAVTFIEGVEELDMRSVGPALVHHEVFPEQANIEFAEVLNPGDAATGASAEIRMRVCERGVGETLACGTGTCATVVAAAVTGRIAVRHATVHLLGGDLRIEWLNNNHVMMTGPATTVYEGTIEL
ncbi:MAG: diaminopimelate epimerase [Coriobacteriales bacterium]|jgi:diaminopimelate epimerase|nr:diaminopimelate epimerase [Coriobacteriales bacterium]